MCGICGYIGLEKIADKKLKEMNDTMYHRGPNDSGEWEKQYDGYAVGMAHRRLSILDLSALGHQPMTTGNGKISIVFNGEIYNYREIKRELVELGYHFVSDSDTEVILTAYHEWDEAFLQKMNGMFALAIFDEDKEQLLLARDRIGKKPLYYYRNNRDFVFASELKPIMKYPDFCKEIREDMIGHFLCNKYIVSPNTIFQNTYKLEPGTCLIWKKNAIIIKKYWDLLDIYKVNRKQQITDYEYAKKLMLDDFEAAVKERMVADVPIGTFLSGGIDSTLVTALAQKINDEPVKTFSIGFYDKERNEAPYSAAISKFLGTKHTELYVEEKDILSMADDLAKYFDEPFSDSSQLPTMMVSKMASEHITVALSGDGGDELYCGYKMYDWEIIAQKCDLLGSMAYHFPGVKDSKLLNTVPMELRAFINNRNNETKSQLFIDVMIEEVQKLLKPEVKNIKYPIENQFMISNWQERRMLLDMLTYLPDEILAKTDRASMKYSLEVRCPILDYRNIERSFRIPHKFKYKGFDKKHILKDITYSLVPKELLDRPKKGFGVPLRKWLRTVLKPKIIKYADEGKLIKQDIFKPFAIQALIIKQEKSNSIVYSSLLWSFYIFQVWYQNYIEDLWG